MRIQIELGLIKRSFCCKCGKKLGRKIICVWREATYKPFGLKFLKERSNSYWLMIPVYYCKHCDYMIKYSNQKKIKIKQKEENSYILSESKILVQKLKISNKDLHK